MISASALAAARAAYDIERDCIEEMKAFFDDQAFSDAVQLLKDAPRIGTSGCGHSGIICQHIAHLLCCIERPARFISPAEAIHGKHAKTPPCPVCGHRCELAADYVMKPDGSQQALCVCGDHGLFFCTVKFQKGEKGRKDMVRTVSMAEEDGTEIDFSPAGIGRLQAKFAEYGPALMNELYASMAFDNRAVHLLMERFVTGQVPLYFHCSAGKDRTGVCAAMLLMALGVPDETVIQEYLLTNEYRARIINLPPDQIPDSVGENERANWAQINSVSADALQAVLDAIDARYPTREAYFAEEFGMDAETLASLRDRYLE